MALSVILEGKKIELSDQDYLSGGGQAKIYKKGDTVYKVFDVSPPRDFEQKVHELSRLGSRSNIVAPQKVLYSKPNQIAGYTMGFVPASLPLPKLFTTGFQTKNGLTGRTINTLIAKMIETIAFIHDQGILMVDGNEFNYLVSGDFRDAFFIDVDSYQTPHFPATVIMPSIRDWQSPAFTAQSDWFSFAVIATQLYLGIHPFRGTWRAHPEVRDLKERVLQRVSVFHPDVTVPSATRDPQSIPPHFRQWLVDTFQKGTRSQPPVPVEAFFIPIPKVVVSGSAVTLTEVGAFDGQSFEAEGQLWVIARGQPLGIHSLTATPVEVDLSPLTPGRPVVFGRRLYFIEQGVLVETRLYPVGSAVKLLERQRWPLSPHAYEVLDGLVAVDHLGARFLAIPYAQGRCGQFRVEAIDGHKVIDGRFHGRVAMLVTSKDDHYYQTELHFDPERETVVFQDQYRIDQIPSLNFVVIRGSTLVRLLEGGTLELSVVGQAGKKTVEGGTALSSGDLTTDGTSLLLAKNERLFRLSMTA